MVTAADVSRSPHARLRPASAGIDGGFWAGRRAHNRDALIPDGRRQLERAGNLHDLRLAAGLAEGDYMGPVYMDSDLHKWVEAVGWEGGDAADDVIDLIAAAQDDDGYLNSCYQATRSREERFVNLAFDHELYCGGHMIQAAVAHARARGEERLLGAARRYADHVDGVFGPGRRAGMCGHPEIETALVELYRLTREERYLALAGFFVDQRGHGLLDPAHFGSQYFQDHLPVREQHEIVGHAVRALYLATAVMDLYLETGERALLDVAVSQWEDMALRKSYVTGGVGARAQDEAFGDAYELPPTSYAETCAAIASVHFSWRLLLATGEARYADQIERTLFNGFAAGVALDDAAYFYVNPLETAGGAERHAWYGCACCPPNVMRMLASLPHYLATEDADGVQLHQYAPGTAGDAVRVQTDYPWAGRIAIEVTRPGDWTLSLRVPSWADGAALDGRPVTPGYVRERREWHAGDTLVLDLPVAPRPTAPHPRIASIQGCLAVERGPLVYCSEAVDGAPDARAGLRDVQRPDLLGGIVAVAAGDALLVPYALWGNRGAGPMRVWLQA